jgi:hypothetical protein
VLKRCSDVNLPSLLVMCASAEKSTHTEALDGDSIFQQDYPKIGRSPIPKVAKLNGGHHQKFEDKWSMISGSDGDLNLNTHLEQCPLCTARLETCPCQSGTVMAPRTIHITDEIVYWCGWRGSNPRPLASEANTLSTELQPQLRTMYFGTYLDGQTRLRIQTHQSKFTLTDTFLPNSFKLDDD